MAESVRRRGVAIEVLCRFLTLLTQDEDPATRPEHPGGFVSKHLKALGYLNYTEERSVSA